MHGCIALITGMQINSRNNNLTVNLKVIPKTIIYMDINIFYIHIWQQL